MSRHRKRQTKRKTERQRGDIARDTEVERHVEGDWSMKSIEVTDLVWRQQIAVYSFINVAGMV